LNNTQRDYLTPFILIALTLFFALAVTFVESQGDILREQLSALVMFIGSAIVIPKIVEIRGARGVSRTENQKKMVF
jgi:hypothetical protein